MDTGGTDTWVSETSPDVRDFRSDSCVNVSRVGRSLPVRGLPREMLLIEKTFFNKAKKGTRKRTFWETSMFRLRT